MMPEYFMIMNPSDSPYTKFRGIGFTPDEFIKMTRRYHQCFAHCCECVITQNGLVFLASPSHSLEVERLKKHGYRGLVLVWYEGICPDPDDTSPKMTKAQIDTIKKLVETRLVSGASYEN